MNKLGEFRKSVLPGGLTLLSQNVNYTSTISIGIWIRNGSRDERHSENGISHLIEHMLFRGTTTRSAYEVARILDKIGGVSNAFTTKDLTCLYAVVLKENFVDIVNIFSDLISNPLFDAEELNKEKSVISQEIDMVLDTPEEYVFDRFYEHIWKDNPAAFPIQGKKDIIYSISRNNLIDYFNLAYTPSNTIISVAGNLDGIPLQELIMRHLDGYLKKNGGIRERNRPNFHPGIHIEKRPMEQTLLIIGFEAPTIRSPDYQKLLLLNIILGGNISSLLFQEIREKRGLSYTIQSFISTLEDCGLIGIYAGTSQRNVCEITSITYSILSDLMTVPLSDEIINEAKEYLRKEILLSLEYNEAIMKKIAKDEIYLGRYKDISEILDEIERITADDIMKLSKEIFAKKGALFCLGNVNDKEIKSCHDLFL